MSGRITRGGYVERWPSRAHIIRSQTFFRTPYQRKTVSQRFNDSGVGSPTLRRRSQPFSSTPKERSSQIYEPNWSDSFLGEYSGGGVFSSGQQSESDLDFKWDHFGVSPQTAEYSGEGSGERIEAIVAETIEFSQTPSNVVEDIEILREIGIFIDYPKGQLGSGLYGVVYRGYFAENFDSPVLTDEPFENVEPNRRFAVKAMDLRKVVWNKHKEFFETEKFILTEVNHKNVVTIRMIINMGEKQSLKFIDYPDIGYTPQDRAYLFMDYADEGTLDKWLSKNYHSIEPITRIKFIKDLFFGMRYLHQNQILHGDVHAGNVLLYTEESELVAKWSDFGLSKSASEIQYRLRGPQITVDYFRQNCSQDLIKMSDIFERILENRNPESETQEESYQLNECQEICEIRIFGSIEEIYDQFSHVFGEELIFDEQHFA